MTLTCDCTSNIIDFSLHQQNKNFNSRLRLLLQNEMFRNFRFDDTILWEMEDSNKCAMQNEWHNELAEHKLDRYFYPSFEVFLLVMKCVSVRFCAVLRNLVMNIGGTDTDTHTHTQTSINGRNKYHHAGLFTCVCVWLCIELLTLWIRWDMKSIINIQTILSTMLHTISCACVCVQCNNTKKNICIVDAACVMRYEYIIFTNRIIHFK